MTSGKADQLAIVADALTCVKCRVNPRFGSLQRCKACLRADAEVERIARERLLPARAAPKSTKQQAAASSSVTRKARRAVRPAPAPARAQAPVAPSRASPQPVRHPPAPMTAKSWKSRLSDWGKRCWGANDLDVQERIGVRDVGCGYYRGAHRPSRCSSMAAPHGVPQMRVIARSDPDLDAMKSVAERMWKMPREGATITANGYSDSRVLCVVCGARVKASCNDNPSRAASCPNRTRGNR